MSQEKLQTMSMQKCSPVTPITQSRFPTRPGKRLRHEDARPGSTHLKQWENGTEIREKIGGQWNDGGYCAGLRIELSGVRALTKITACTTCVHRLDTCKHNRELESPSKREKKYS